MVVRCHVYGPSDGGVFVYQATGNRAYLDYMDREFWITNQLLYRPQEHLYSRDATFLNTRSANGQLLFWSRVMDG